MRLLDILIGTLVVFPWLTEWIARPMPGLPLIQISDLGVPLLVVSLVFLALARLKARSAGARWAHGRGGHAAVEGCSARRLLAYAAGLAGALIVATMAWRWLTPSEGLNFGYVLWAGTHGMGAVFVVALAAIAIRRCSDEPWEKSVFVRAGVRVGRLWIGAVERNPARTLWLAAAVVAVDYLAISILRFRAFEAHGFDLGIFTNVMWNLVHGNGYISSVKGGMNLFSDHQSPLFFLVAPVFWAIPRPETLLLVQSVGLAAGGPALYYLTRKRFGVGSWAPAALPWIYWTYLPLRNASTFDFHPEVFMLPLFLWAFAAFESSRGRVRLLGALALVGALGAKESAGVVAAGIGIAWALAYWKHSARDRWLGVGLAAAGAAVFMFDVTVVPKVFGGGYAYMNLYGRFGGGITDVVLAPFTEPVLFLSQLFDRARLNFLFWTLAPLGFLPLFNWRAALAALPPYLMLFLSEGDQRVRIVFHYGIEPGTALFWALPFGLAAFARRYGWKAAGMWMLFWSVACLGPSEMMRARDYDQTPHAHWLATQAMPCINADAPTAATDVLVPHLATRRWISYPDKLIQLPTDNPVRCVVTDRDVDNWPIGKDGLERVLAGLPGKGYHRAWSCAGFSVYQLGTSECLRCTPSCP